MGPGPKTVCDPETKNIKIIEESKATFLQRTSAVKVASLYPGCLGRAHRTHFRVRGYSQRGAWETKPPHQRSMDKTCGRALPHGSEFVGLQAQERPVCQLRQGPWVFRIHLFIQQRRGGEGMAERQVRGWGSGRGWPSWRRGMSPRDSVLRAGASTVD